MYQKESLLDLLGNAHWYQKAIIHMIIDYMDNYLPDKHLPLSENDITALDEIFIVIRKFERFNLLDLTSALFMLHQVMLRLSVNPNPSSIPDIIVISAIMGSKLGFEDTVFNKDFTHDFHYKSKYHQLKTLHLLEREHLRLCNFQVDLPINMRHRVARIAELLNYVPKADLQDLIDHELPKYKDQNIVKLAQALLDANNIDIKNAAPNRHLQSHNPKLFKGQLVKLQKPELKTKDDFNVDYRGTKKSGK